MSETFHSAEQEERNWSTATPEEFRAEMKRIRTDLTEKVNAFVNILDGYARPVEHTNPPDTNETKPIDANEESSF